MYGGTSARPQFAAVRMTGRTEAARRGLADADAVDCCADFVEHCVTCQRGSSRRRLGRRCPPALLKTCAVHFVQNRVRDLRRRRAHEIALAARREAAAPGSESPDVETMRHEFWRVVAAALDGLPPGARSAVGAVLLGGEAPEAVALRESTTVAAVRKAVQRGRRTLRTVLEAAGHDEADLREYLVQRPPPRRPATGARDWPIDTSDE